MNFTPTLDKKSKKAVTLHRLAMRGRHTFITIYHATIFYYCSIYLYSYILMACYAYMLTVYYSYTSTVGYTYMLTAYYIYTFYILHKIKH